jgi:hypothetical protein
MRMLGGGVPMMRMRVTRVDAHYVYCGDWQFDIKTGGEIDAELGWTATMTGSYIVIEDA